MVGDGLGGRVGNLTSSRGKGEGGKEGVHANDRGRNGNF